VLAGYGVRVPDDVSVVGFDDSLLAHTAVPKLTTVRQPLREMGSRAVKELLAQIESRKSTAHAPLPTSPIVFPVSIVLRSSVGAPPTAPVFAKRTIR